MQLLVVMAIALAGAVKTICFSIGTNCYCILYININITILCYSSQHKPVRYYPEDIHT